ncbi:MAG: acyltransferase family protein [Candidatus Methylumidiphilus sp.]
MSPALSAYLDAVRLTAALMVFAHHASYPRFGGEWIAALAGYGHESVVVFFMLSGFVIALSHANKDRTPRQSTSPAAAQSAMVAVDMV